MPARIALLFAVGSLAVAGCGGGDKPEPSAPELPVAEGPKQPEPKPPASQKEVKKADPTPAPQPAVPPVLPSDLGGRAVTKALMPSVPGGPKPPTVKLPRTRVPPLDGGDLPLPKVGFVRLPATPKLVGKSAKPSPPVEVAPPTIGNAAAVGTAAFAPPEHLLLKATATANPGATDVPAMARQLPDRAPVADPTVELSAKGIVATPLPLPATELPYLREVIPNPFEFAEHLKGKLGTDTELGTTPAVVNPEKR